MGNICLDRPNPVCMKEIGEAYCGYCVWTVGEKVEYIGNEWNHLLQVKGKKKRWDTIRAEGVTVPAESQADLKANMINACKATGVCDKEISRWRLKWDALDSVSDAFKK